MSDFDRKEEIRKLKKYNEEREARRRAMYPLTVNEISSGHGEAIIDYWGGETGALVKIRAVPSVDPEEKTRLGFLLGEVARGQNVEFDKETGHLTIGCGKHNPAIFVPELKRVVFGSESWWGVIESPEEIEQITDEDIENVWYVKMFNSLATAPAAESSDTPHCCRYGFCATGLHEPAAEEKDA